MIASFLPLPIKTTTSQANSRDNLQKPNDVENDYSRQFGPLDEARYENARWWRNLNRCMSVVGVVIIVVVVCLLSRLLECHTNNVQIVLAVVGTRNRW
jgi:hypothetical protein